jgi:hypothetical protein
MKGDMDINKVAEFLVLMVILAIGIGLITLYSQNSKDYLGGISNEKYNTSMVQAESFSDSQIKLYIRSCWQKVQDKKDVDFVCYILEGDMGRINKSNLSDSGQEYKLDVSGFRTNSPIASISYNHMANAIEIKN